MDRASSRKASLIDLDKAVVALEESTRLLSPYILSGSDQLIESQLSSIKADWLKLADALRDRLDHFAEV
jgi:hypothetical protein